MTVIARFEVIPVRDGSMSTAIARALQALDQHPVSYQTTATDTIIEADTAEQIFAAVQAAHQAIPEDRVITSLEIDEDRRRVQNMSERVASVGQALGHSPQRLQHPPQQSAPQQSAPQQPAPPRQPSPPQQTAPPAGVQPQGQPHQPMR